MRDDASAYTCCFRSRPGTLGFTRTEAPRAFRSSSGTRRSPTLSGPPKWNRKITTGGTARLRAGSPSAIWPDTGRPGLGSSRIFAISTSQTSSVTFAISAPPCRPPQQRHRPYSKWRNLRRLRLRIILGCAARSTYRTGSYEAAIADLDHSALVYPRRAWDWLFLAMAHHKLGYAEQAQRALRNAEEWIERANRMQIAGSKNIWIGWYEVLEVAQLHKEASELIHVVP